MLKKLSLPPKAALCGILLCTALPFNCSQTFAVSLSCKESASFSDENYSDTSTMILRNHLSDSLYSLRNKNKPDILNALKGESNILQDTLDMITVSAGIENVKRSPLRLKTVTQKEIKEKSVGKTFPEMLGGISGIYATRESGSYGDAKINIRGFKQENISVLLNGIPISGLTSGNMFWNNWMGLADATASIQLQKGIGASMLSDNSVGGTINIITANSLRERTVEAGYSTTCYGAQKIYANFSSGELPRGWSFSVIGSYVWGHGYVNCTNVNSWAYLVSIDKKINSKHSFNFTALGSPERHQQRSYRLTYDEIEKYGTKYNKNWGWYDGSKKTIAENNYYKPYFTLNHYFNTKIGNSDINLRTNTALYLAIGVGGGLYPECKNYGAQIISFMKEGQIDWNAVIDNNKNNYVEDTNIAGSSASNIISDYRAGHTQIGFKSSMNILFASGNEIEAGLHYQMYDKWENERIKDLLGADYWYEDYASKSLAGEAGRNPYKKEGDYIRTYNGTKMDYMTAYALSTLNIGAKKNWIIKTGVSMSGSVSRRWDRYNYVSDCYSDFAYGLGGSFKAGILYIAASALSFYLNGAAYSRAPYSSVFFANGNNTIADNVKNENNLLAEIGTRFVSDRYGIESTFYIAYWKNKTLLSDKYKPLNGEESRYMATGLNALHYGIEIDAFYRFGNIARLSAFASVGEWKWKNDVHATIYDPYSGQKMGAVDVYSNELHVGDAPQTQIGLSAFVTPVKTSNTRLAFNADWSYNDRFWADFDPSSRTNADDRSDSYRIPSYHLLNMGAVLERAFSLHKDDNGNRVKIFKLRFFVNINNVMDSKYVERSKDGKNHDKATFTGYWGARRNMNAGMNIVF